MADLERRCRTCGQVAAHRKGDRLLALQHSVYVCVESLQTQLTHSQGRIAELSARAQSAAKMIIEDVVEHLYSGYSGTALEEAKLAAYLLERDYHEVYKEAHEQAERLKAEEQQSTTLTKEGGGE